ncbi:hypothetical protein M595_2762 [Lyngbya aestuarii BL J]|uniref:Uncharacterized protein n=1 Tax=Lyngbya aestuarii BL J TaxID=1348334 RepID=U7QIW2_9CYAN|nr:hypothetical protein M595_2762 [Lyngbya aestuarii BL J]
MGRKSEESVAAWLKVAEIATPIEKNPKSLNVGIIVLT